MRSILLASLGLMLTAGVALADEKFTAMDTDKNGQVNWEEFQAAYPNMKRPAFDAVDTDKNGAISHDEWDAFRSSHAGARGSMGGGMGGAGGTMPIMPMPKGDAPAGDVPLIRPPKQ